VSAALRPAPRDDDAQTFADIPLHALLRAIDALPDHLRATARLRWMLGERHTQIADTLDCPVSLVQMRVRLAYQAITELLTGMPHHEMVHREPLRRRALMHFAGMT
jgi:DNA-directed RNA polymerase specialized sigma24 family protein